MSMNNYNGTKKSINTISDKLVNSKAALNTVINQIGEMSKFNLPKTHATSFNSGDIVPILHMEMLPADTFDISTSALVRTSLPKASTWEIAKMEFTAFFVPNRFLWKKWVNFAGQNDDFGNEHEIPKVLPTFEFSFTDQSKNTINWPQAGDLMDYLGFPCGVYKDCKTKFATPQKRLINGLIFLGYFKIYNDWYRSEFLQPAIVFNKFDDDVNPVIKIDLSQYELAIKDHIPQKVFESGSGLLQSCKLDDLFTTALPFPQLGEAVSLPMDLSGLYVTNRETDKVTPENSFSPVWYSGTSPIENDDITLHAYDAINTNSQTVGRKDPNIGDVYYPVNLSLKVDGETQIFPTILDLRKSIALQHYKEIQARNGTRYVEFLKSHFGVSVPSIEFERSELISSYTVDLSIQNVIQTSSSTENSPLGQVAGIGMNTAFMPKFSYTAKEHGQLYIMVTIRPVNSYPYSLPKKFFKVDFLDFYDTCFDNIGDQPILNKEIYYADDESVDDLIFGYNINYYEYKFESNQMSGALHPNAKNSIAKMYKYFETYTKAPSLNAEFIRQDKHTIGESLLLVDDLYEFGAFQFVAQFNFSITAIRPMSYNKAPGIHTV